MTTSPPVGAEAPAESNRKSVAQARRPGVSIVIPSWNGWELLRRHLPSVTVGAEAYRSEGGEAEIIVVDDGSRDKTVAALAERFPEITVVARPENGGFAKACNSGFAVCRHPLVALLNNDVQIDPWYFRHLARHFGAKDIFAVTARIFEFDPPRFATGGKVGRFRRGFWSVYFNYDLEQEDVRPDTPLLSMYAVGGFAMYDRLKLKELGGFDELLSPFHWEDVDLSYRAWKRGWRVLYEPRAVGYHQISATIDAHYAKPRVEELAVRNRLLFHWVNLHAPGYWARHLLMLSILLLTRVLAGDLSFYRSFWGALRLGVPAARRRRQERARSRISDPDVAGLLRRFYQDAPIRIFQGQADVGRAGPSPPRSSSPSAP